MDVNEPKKTETVDISADDHTFALRVQSIYCNVAGLVVLKLHSDSGNHKRRVIVGQTIFGDFEKVIRTGTDAGFQAADSLVGMQSQDYEVGNPNAP